MKKLMNKKRPGFTLVEMVVVVSILGILAGLGFMKFDQVQAKARKNADDVAATNLATAASLYINDNPKLAELVEINGESKSKELKLETLVNLKYITAIPEPQSIDGKFSIIVSDSKEVMVKAGDDKIYPKELAEDINISDTDKLN